MTKKRYYYKGKRVSKGEQKVAAFLNKNKIIFIQEYSFPDLLSKKNKRLRFDFFIPSFNLLIEVQGEHHYKPVNQYRRAKRVHQQTVFHDNLKQDYCLKNSIRFLRIPYTEFDKIEETLITIINAFKKRS